MIPFAPNGSSLQPLTLLGLPNDYVAIVCRELYRVAFPDLQDIRNLRGDREPQGSAYLDDLSFQHYRHLYHYGKYTVSLHLYVSI